MLSSNYSDTTPDNTHNNPTAISPTSITIGTQKIIQNIAQGLKPLNPLIVKFPFDEITLEKLRNY